ncbi:LytR/AlgR family response regulator transcription factor [Sphingomonas alpina]|uniref:Response regulator transcription factor n=1 Tax=Sphingomonas alpina TaxID=653931 RepID=A0A7H0LF21_9SPHN|nr:LytTR family DNA-binding domain-containing protein [Sphingomonas alpina]QNQ08274.1 response regulator transcription factor [Sphingomonas alpina]
MSEFSVVTVDDEPLALSRLEIVLRGVPGARLVGSASSCDAAVALITERRPDIVLLDIRLRDGTGFDILDRLPRDVTPAVIFITAFDHFAIRAFEVSAVDYVLKPIDAGRLREAVDRARARIIADDSVGQVKEMRAVIADLRAEFHDKARSPYETELWIRGVTGNLTRVSLDLVDWVSSEDDYVRLHTGATSHLLRLSIRAFEARVDPTQFVRVHRAALVRVSRIAEVRRSLTGRRDVILRDGTRIATGRIHAKRLRAVLLERDGPNPGTPAA